MIAGGLRRHFTYTPRTERRRFRLRGLRRCCMAAPKTTQLIFSIFSTPPFLFTQPFAPHGLQKAQETMAAISRRVGFGKESRLYASGRRGAAQPSALQRVFSARRAISGADHVGRPTGRRRRVAFGERDATRQGRCSHGSSDQLSYQKRAPMISRERSPQCRHPMITTLLASCWRSSDFSIGRQKKIFY